jgi:hypothetical protein
VAVAAAAAVMFFSVALVAFFSQITATSVPELPQTATDCHKRATNTENDFEPQRRKGRQGVQRIAAAAKFPAGGSHVSAAISHLMQADTTMLGPYDARLVVKVL